MEASAKESKVIDGVMTRAARGMSVASIANDLDVPIERVLDALWRHGGDEQSVVAGDPTPEQIRLRCLAIRSGWTPEELERREMRLIGTMNGPGV